MNSHEEMLDRMGGANPLPDVEMITDGQLAEMTLQIDESRRSQETSDQPQQLVPTRQRVRWLRPAVAFAAAMLIAAAVVGVVSLTTGGESDVADQSSTTTTTAPTTTTVDAPPDGWNPVLATLAAGPAPEAAACPPGTDPSQPGPASQDRPKPGSLGLLSAAFDHRTGQVIYVDGDAATWAFDVCTNTWANLHPAGVPTGNISGGLIYDVDSDLIVALEADEIFVYDAAGNTWENRVNASASAGLVGPPYDPVSGLIGAGPIGAAYDPVSGLIVTSSPLSDIPSDDWLISAYDVDTDTWHDLGTVPLTRETPCCTGIDLLGYSAGLDRLILTTYIDEQEATLLLDVRTGEMSTHITPTPIVNLAWPGRSYGQGETVYIEADSRVEDGRWNTVLCGFDPDEIAWNRCYSAPEDFPALRYDMFNAIVGDPINDRLLLLGGTYNTFSSDPPGTNDVWAIDLGTGEWAEVLAPT